MHPSELKNQALVATAAAEREGFDATAETSKVLALICAEEARGLIAQATIFGQSYGRRSLSLPSRPLRLA